MQTWRLLAIISIILCIVLFLIIKGSKLLVNKYYYSCREDKLEKTQKRKGARYDVFECLGASARFIDKYIIKHVGKKKTLICDYVESFKYISYYVLLFDKRKKLMKIMEISEHSTAFCSKPITLPKKCEKINIVVNHINEDDLGIKLKGEVSLGKIKAFSILETIALFCFLFSFRHLLIEILCLDSKLIFMQSIYNVISILIIAFFAFLNYFILSSKLKKDFKYEKQISNKKVVKRKVRR